MCITIFQTSKKHFRLFIHRYFFLSPQFPEVLNSKYGRHEYARER